ncbi:endonuclease G-like 1 [Cryptosporidium ryanae]|uniref:endonuclease G-like 1 n=1 Tax=Cryptosporidium ryanae TaxID=515981 RepID=UPI00351A547C|nr:endonuclease G-like 1 [Cryptosporidium ryanae]
MNSKINLGLGVAIGGALGYLLYPKIESNKVRVNFINGSMNILGERKKNAGYYIIENLINKITGKKMMENIRVTGGFYPSSRLPSNENLIIRESYLSSVSFRNKIPNWVAERITKETCNGKAERSNCVFQVDPDIPLIWSAENKDYFGSGYSRGHLAAAGQHKDTPKAQSDTFYLSGNIVPQELSNNGGDWYRLELLSRKLTDYYEDVYVVSGPLFMPNNMRSEDFIELAKNMSSEKEEPPKDALGQICVIHKKDVVEKARELGDEKKINPKLIVNSDMKDSPIKKVTYEVIGNKCVSVPTHLFKIILGAKPRKGILSNNEALPPVVLGSFIMKNAPEEIRRELREYLVPLKSIEISTGLNFSGIREFTGLQLKKSMTKKEFKKRYGTTKKFLSLFPYLSSSSSFLKDNEFYNICNLRENYSKYGDTNGRSICMDTDSDRVTAWRYLGYLTLSKTKQELDKIWKTIKEREYDIENIFLRKEYVNKCKSFGHDPNEL